MHLLILRTFDPHKIFKDPTQSADTLKNTLRVSRWGAGRRFCVSDAACVKWVAPTPTAVFRHVVTALKVSVMYPGVNFCYLRETD